MRHTATSTAPLARSTSPLPWLALRSGCVVAALVWLSACGGGASGDAGVGGAAEPLAPELLADSGLSGGNAPLAQTDQLIVRFDQTLTELQFAERAAEFERSLSLRAGVPLQALRQTASGSVVMAMPQALDLAATQALATRLAGVPGVAYAEPDHLMWAESKPNDPRWGQQWLTGPRSAQPGQIDLAPAWTLTTGRPDAVVAVLDTGVLPHADLVDRLLPGYDFVSDVRRGNDGDGRDGDASDPGDWIDGSEPWARDVPPRASTWHGTHIAGIVAAVRNNALGVAGVAPDVRVLPVRVLGRGGGYVSDIADGLRWAVGQAVPGAPANPHPARIVNLSFGARGSCSGEMQSAVDEAHRRGALLIASAGNSGIDVSQTTTASCQHVLPVVAVGRGGERAAYSNSGSGVWLAAPGGNYPADSGVVSLADGGTTTPLRDHSYRHKQGTSVAAPVVSAVAALAWSANPGLNAAQLRALMEAAAQPFPTGTADDCSTTRCGVGIVNAAAAVSLAALSPVSAPASDATPAAPWPVAGAWQDATRPQWRVWMDARGGEVLWALQGAATPQGPAWALARLRWDATAQQWAGDLFAHRDGTRLNGGALSPLPQAALGRVELNVHSATHATARWGTDTLELRPETAPASPLTADLPIRSGLWWAPDRPGKVFAVDWRNGRPLMVLLGYADSGQPAVLQADMLPVSQQRWQGFTLPWPTQVGAQAAFEWLGQANDRAEMRLTDGRIWALRAGPEPAASQNPQTLSAGLLGIWDAQVGPYVFNERWTLGQLRASDVQVGDHNVFGFNQWGGTMLGGWSSRFGNYSLYAPGLLLDDFYVFQPSGNAQWQGCYHYFQLATQRLSDCVPLTAGRAGSAAQAASVPWPSPGWSVGDRSKETALLASPPQVVAYGMAAYLPEFADLPDAGGSVSAKAKTATASGLMVQALALRAQARQWPQPLP